MSEMDSEFEKYPPYCVLMSVYYKEKPEFLRESIESMLNQTVPLEQFVLVCDGPLTNGLDAVVLEYEQTQSQLFTIVRLEENLGIGGAAQAGFVKCRNELIAKMDSDDIARPYRCQTQLCHIMQNPELSILGGCLSEFIDNQDNPAAIRRVPKTHSEIIGFSRKRNPFNNQTVIFRKSAVEAVGGYSPLKRVEDYDLYMRMLHNGAMAENLEDILVDYRLDENAYRRRGNWLNVSSVNKIIWGFYRAGYISFIDFTLTFFGHLFLWICPNILLDFIYKRLLRR